MERSLKKEDGKGKSSKRDNNFKAIFFFVDYISLEEILRVYLITINILSLNYC